MAKDIHVEILYMTTRRDCAIGVKYLTNKDTDKQTIRQTNEQKMNKIEETI